ncbi:MAG: hypothetical protein M9894_11730 [Planctomycetes bacterium]|nr:hypothetical protein [Planctomycetota bacterium]
MAHRPPTDAEIYATFVYCGAVAIGMGLALLGPWQLVSPSSWKIGSLLVGVGVLCLLPPVQAAWRALRPPRSVEGAPAPRAAQAFAGARPAPAPRRSLERARRAPPRVEPQPDGLLVTIPLDRPPAEPIDVRREAVSPRLTGRRVFVADEPGAELSLGAVFGNWRARRLWVEADQLHLDLDLTLGEFEGGRTPRVDALLAGLADRLEVVPAVIGAARARLDQVDHARTAAGRALGERLEGPRVERAAEGGEVVAGRDGDRRVTLRCGVDGGATLSFDLGSRVALDLEPGALPATVAERIASGGDVAGLDAADAALVTLFGALGARRLHTAGRRAHVELPLPLPSQAPAWAERALGALAGLEAVGRVLITVGRPRESSAGVTCPYCRDPVDGLDARACAGCGTRHHDECLAEAGGCTVLGCAARPRARAQMRA